MTHTHRDSQTPTRRGTDCRGQSEGQYGGQCLLRGEETPRDFSIYFRSRNHQKSPEANHLGSSIDGTWIAPTGAPCMVQPRRLVHSAASDVYFSVAHGQDLRFTRQRRDEVCLPFGIQHDVEIEGRKSNTSLK